MAAQGSSIIVHPSTWAWYRLLVERYVGQLALELAIWSLSGPFASLRAVKEAETREVWTPLGVLREGGPTFDSLPNELVAKIARRLDGQSLAVLACLSRRCQEVASDESVWKAVTVRAFPWVPADLEPASWRDVYRFHHAAFSLVRGRRSSGGHVPARGMGDVFTLGTQGHVALGG